MECSWELPWSGAQSPQILVNSQQPSPKTIKHTLKIPSRLSGVFAFMRARRSGPRDLPAQQMLLRIKHTHLPVREAGPAVDEIKRQPRFSTLEPTKDLRIVVTANI